MEKNAPERRGRGGVRVGVVRVVAALALLCVLLASCGGATATPQGARRSMWSSEAPATSSVDGVDGASDRPSQIALRADARHHRAGVRSLRETPLSSGAAPERARRRLPGGYPEFDELLGGEAAGGAVLLVLLLIFLCCCCRGRLCDLLACVCLYEMCCDDGVVGGFDMMPDC